MAFDPITAAGLGPPHDEEPANLRRDIADEIADHLECALRHELRRIDDEDEAKQAVLDRFGDPQKIARQLWWQAMKEKIMKDRITMLSVATLAVVCVAACVLAWTALQQSRQTNAALLAALQAAKGQPADLMEWSHLSIRLIDPATCETVAGVKVQFHGHAVNATENNTLEETTDDQGVARFGPIRLGTYSIHLPGELFQKVTLFPGKEQSLVLALPPMVGVSVRLIGFPADLQAPKQLSVQLIWAGLLGPPDPTGTTAKGLGGFQWIDLNSGGAAVPGGDRQSEPTYSNKLVEVPTGRYRLDHLGIQLPQHYYQSENGLGVFEEAKAAGENVWEVHLTPELIQDLRDHLPKDPGHAPAAKATSQPHG